MRRSAGHSLVELVLVLVLLGLLLAFGLPRIAGWGDRIAVHRAASELASFYDVSRYAAIMRARRVRLEFAADTLRAVYESAVDSEFLGRPGPSHLGVRLRVSRSVIRVGPTGLGWGAANTKLVLMRGVAAESLTTSRLGRIKHWR
ncbi:MAG TPA: prepilin-type N-terminal cleavage/methylation domain-containing protein [Gemmatimonadales bacterium]|jgi:Tfp pilus assembly protein FimT|nr:prepilin-type N-terminal cleavage/methylation domain-containing protein [Gemmatimonadales bacterium]